MLVEAKKTEMAADEEPLPDVEPVAMNVTETKPFIPAECYGRIPQANGKAA